MTISHIPAVPLLLLEEEDERHPFSHTLFLRPPVEWSPPPPVSGVSPGPQQKACPDQRLHWRHSPPLPRLYTPSCSAVLRPPTPHGRPCVAELSTLTIVPMYPFLFFPSYLPILDPD
jgi:hypothetical protein